MSPSQCWMISTDSKTANLKATTNLDGPTLNSPTLESPTLNRPIRNRGRRAWAAVGVVAIVLSVFRAGLDPSNLINTRGWPQVQDFFVAAIHPELSRDFLALTVREAAVTLSFALLGTALALLIGLFGGVLLTERIWSPMAASASGSSQAGHARLTRRGRAGWALGRLAFAIPRSMHEVVFALLLVNILGLNPLVAILAIGIPFGAVTAKVFSELLDEVPTSAELGFRASGAGRVSALLFGTFPQAMGDLLSYAFYRFECSIRSAAVLGIVGAGGIGFQLALSFQSLRYEEMWTLLWALIILSGIADRWSTVVRRRRNTAAVEMGMAGDNVWTSRRKDPFLRGSALLLAIMVPVAYWWLDLDLSTLWNSRARTLGNELVADAFPPKIGLGGWAQLVSDSVDTIALAVLALGLAWLIGTLVSFLAARPDPIATESNSRSVGGWHLVWSGFSGLIRFILLVSRSVPPPVWAFIVVFVVFPGLWPGVIALAIYNAGVLGRLQAEVLENIDRGPEEALRATGATMPGALIFATVPAVSGRFVALGLYRWEVAIRETVIVGVVGAAGLGRRLDEQTSAFDYQGIVATILALLAVTVVVDLASASVRRTIR